MTSYGTVDLIELIWTLAALPGLAVWVVNLRSAYRSLRAVKTARIVNGRRMVARYAVRKCWALIWITNTFVLLGIISMLRPPNEATPHWDWLRIVLTAGLLGASALITGLGFDWRHVEHQILIRAQRDALRPPERTDR